MHHDTCLHRRLLWGEEVDVDLSPLKRPHTRGQRQLLLRALYYEMYNHCEAFLPEAEDFHERVYEPFATGRDVTILDAVVLDPAARSYTAGLWEFAERWRLTRLRCTWAETAVPDGLRDLHEALWRHAAGDALRLLPCGVGLTPPVRVKVHPYTTPWDPAAESWESYERRLLEHARAQRDAGLRDLLSQPGLMIQRKPPSNTMSDTCSLFEHVVLGMPYRVLAELTQRDPQDLARRVSLMARELGLSL